MTIAVIHYKDAVVSVPSPATLPALLLEVAFTAPAGHIYEDAVLADQAVAYYRLNETAGAVAADKAGNVPAAYVGTVTKNQSSLLTGDGDKSILLAGAGNVEIPDHPKLRVTASLTLEAWINPDTFGPGPRYIFNKTNSFAFYLNSAGIPVFTYFDNPELPAIPTAHTFPFATSLSLNTTYHMMLTLGPEWIRGYINGVMVLELGTPGINISWTDEEIAIGSSFSGKIDEAAIYTQELSKERAAYHYGARLASPTITWTTVSDDVPASSRLLDFSCKRGRADEFRGPDTGTFTGELRNQDRRFDPQNTASPYYPNLKPVKQVRLTATIGGSVYPVWRGDIQEWPQHWVARENTVPLQANDAWDFLAGAGIEVLTRPAELTGARVSAILDAAGWPRARRSINPGLSMVQAIDKAQGNAKAMLETVNGVESGQLFVDRNGDIVFKNRMDQVLNSPIVVTFSNMPTGAEVPVAFAQPEEDKNAIRNSITITMDGGTEFKAEDPASMLAYRKRTYAVTLPFDNPNEAQAKAEWTLAQYKDPFPHVAEAVLEPQMDTDLWPIVLGCEIGQRVRFKLFPPGGGVMYDLQCFIELVEHRYIVGRWTTKMRFSPADTQTYWILGTSLLGTDTRLAY